MLDDLVEAISNNSNNNNNNNNESNSKNVNENESEYESEGENENEKEIYYYEMRQLNNWFETIDQTKPLEEQIELLKERGEFLAEYWHVEYYRDNKELNYKILKAKTAHVLIDIDEQLFKKLFGHKFVALVDKLINKQAKKKIRYLLMISKKIKIKFMKKMNMINL